MSKLYPVNVDPTPEQARKLVSIFRSAQTRIVKEIATATDFGVSHRKAILLQVDEILIELGEDIQVFTDKTLSGFYKEGADMAVKQLKNVDADIAVKSGFNRLHRDAIIALVDDTVSRYAEAITGVKRSTQRLLGQALRQQLAQEIAFGALTGDALRTVRRNIKGLLQEEGLAALVDKGGRKWSLDRYSEMLYRTKIVEARNMGLANRMAENNYDLVQVSDHEGECQLCRPWEGKILSITGNTKKYPSLQTAIDAGLFHPNCKHAINALIPKIAKQTKAYDPEKGTYVTG